MQNSINRVNIYDPTDDLVLTLDLQQASSVVETVGGDCYVRIVSNNTRGVILLPYSYIEYNGERWYIRNFTSPQLQDGYYSYDVNFYRPYNLLSNFVFARPVSVTDQQGVTTSWIEPNFAINANKKTICEIVLSCIDKVITQRFQNWFSHEFERMSLPAGNDYQDTDLKAFSFAGVSIKQALDDIAKAYECDWWIAGGVLYMQKHETSTTHTLATGYNAGTGETGNTSNGIASIKYGAANNKATKIYMYGGTRNITPKQANENGLDISYDTRLRLEENHRYSIQLKDGSTVTLQTNERGGVGHDMGTEEVIIDESIYPSITFAINATPVAHNQANGKPYYSCKATALNATQATLLAGIQQAQGVTPSIVFSSGNLNGMEFEVRFATNAEKYGDFDFTIIPIESDYALIPNPVLIPKLGDQFVLLGVVLSPSYLYEARQRLAEKAYEKLIEYQNAQPVVEIKCEPRFIEENGLSIGLGDVVTVNDVHFAGGSYTNRVEWLKYPICSPCEVEIKLSERKQIGLIKEREYELKEVKEWYEKYISAALGENRFIDIYRGGEIEALGTLVRNVSGLVPAGVVSESDYALAANVTKETGRISLSKGVVLGKSGNTISTPQTSVNTSILQTSHVYGVFAEWEDGEDTATTVVKDLNDGAVVPVASANSLLLGTIYSVNDVWNWRFSGVRPVAYTGDGVAVAADITLEDFYEEYKSGKISAAFGRPYVGEELVLSDAAARLLSKRLGGGGEQGKDGKSAYEIAVEQGYKGTVEEWLKSLKGEQGIQGEKGDKGDSYSLTQKDLDNIAQQAAELIENAEKISW